MKAIKTLFLGILRIIYFLPLLALVVLLVLYFGNSILGPGLTGSDNTNFLGLASWLSDWFPRIPFWFPQEGGGLSFTISYPILNHLIVILVEKLFSIPIAVAFRIWSLIAVVLASVGLYLLSFRLTKNQTVSSLAAIFYTLCPITWVFLLEWGFAAEQLSYLYIPPVLIFLSLFLDEFYTKGLTFKTKIYFLLYAVSFAILPMAHPIVFNGTLVFTAILLVIYPLLNFRRPRVGFKKVVLVGSISILTVFLLSSYWIIPYFRYQSITAQGAPTEKEKPVYQSYMQHTVYAVNVFNITNKTSAYESYDDPIQLYSPWPFRNVSFPFIINVLALVGLVGSFFINRKVFSFGLAILLPLTLAVTPQLTFILIKIPFLGLFLNWRGMITPSRFIIPLLAGFGCYALAYLVSFPLGLLSKKVKPFIFKFPIKLIFILLTAGLTLTVASVLLWKFKNWPFSNPSFLVSYGVETSAPSRKIDLRNVWRKELDYCFGGSVMLDKLGKEEFEICSKYTLHEYFWTHKLSEACGVVLINSVNLPAEITSLCSMDPGDDVVKKVADNCDKEVYKSQFIDICNTRTANSISQLVPDSWTLMLESKKLFTDGKEIFGPDIGILDYLPDNNNTRIDIATAFGGHMMALPFYSDVPELPVYFNIGTLMYKLWNYQISVFNQVESPWPQAKIMYELSKYFGLEYMLLPEDIMPMDRYLEAGWESFKRWYEDSGWLTLWKFKEPVGLLRATTKPVVLVIGQDKVDGYFRIFHLANLGVLSFEDGILVKGEANPDAYSVDELSKFDAVVLEGYTYKNQKRGWKVLDEYVKNGGSLLINTGWQYSSADWELDDTPEFFPLTTLEWIDIGTTGDYVNENIEIVGDVDIKKFDPLVFAGKAWNISSSDRVNLRDWAQVIISANDVPIAAGGQYGKGRVVWLGLDLPGHIAAYKDNEEEVVFYKNLVSYLLKGKDGKVLEAGFKRDYPDKLEITINESSNQKTTIYWSEAYYPDFKAKLIENGKTKRIEKYKAGPGMTLFILPRVSAGSKIIYEYKTPAVVIFARIISLATLTILIIAIVRQQFLLRINKLFFGKRGVIRKKYVGKILGDKHDEEVNY